MLGGYAHISTTDIKDSKKFLKGFLEVSEVLMLLESPLFVPQKVFEPNT